MEETYQVSRKKVYNPVGKHFLIDLIDCQCGSKLLDNERKLISILTRCVLSVGATPLKQDFYRFEPQGVSAFVFLAESHIAIYTYPEYSTAFLDFFTCGEEIDPKGSVKILVEQFKPARIRRNLIFRGGKWSRSKRVN